ncbi:MAG TPA: exosortase H [Candidatus Deferrimicrobium sp.]|nr:exosortase H [Candidatus Deferrimicrobium sp.]
MVSGKYKFDKSVVKTLVKLYFAFGSILLLFVIAFQFDAVHLAVVAPFTSVVAAASSLAMNLFGAGAMASGNFLSTANYSINVVDGCNGIYATAILIAGIIAYPSRLIHKVWGVVLGTLAVFVLNLGRVISLFYLGQHYPDLFEEVHVYVWQPIIIVWAIFVWDFWSRQSAKSKKAVLAHP